MLFAATLDRPARLRICFMPAALDIYCRLPAYRPARQSRVTPD